MQYTDLTDMIILEDGHTVVASERGKQRLIVWNGRSGGLGSGSVSTRTIPTQSRVRHLSTTIPASWVWIVRRRRSNGFRF